MSSFLNEILCNLVAIFLPLHYFIYLVFLISYLLHLSPVTTSIAASPNVMPFFTCLLLAATMSSTDSASVFSILKDQKIRLKHNLRPLLELESGSNDPMAYMLTIVLIQIMSGGQTTPLDIFTNFLIQFALGGFIGFAMGKCITLLINHINIKNRSLYSIMVLALIFFTFTLSDMAKGNGYLAVYIAGMMVGNSKILYRRDISTFLDGLTWFFQIIMFLVLGLLVSPRAMFFMAIPAIIISIIMIFLARPLSVWACLLPYRKSFPVNARRYASWVGLRGAAPIMFATYPLVYEVEGSEMIFNIVFFVTLFSLLVQGMTLSKVAYKLDLVDEDKDEDNDYGIELSDEFDRKVREYIISGDDLDNGNRIMDLNVNKGSVIVLVKRGNKTLTPKGSLELEIMKDPKKAPVIPKTGRLRKMRWEYGGKGKRGGARVCYVDFIAYETIYLISVFAKNEKKYQKINDDYYLTDKITSRQFAELTNLDVEVVNVLYSAYAYNQEQYGPMVTGIDDYEIPIIDLFLFLYDQYQQGYVSLDGEMDEYLNDLYETLGNRQIRICKELTKIHEKVLSFTLDEAIKYLQNSNENKAWYYLAKIYIVKKNYSTAKDFIKNGLQNYSNE